MASGLFGAAYAAGADSSVFNIHKVMDTNGSGHVALTYLLPKGWKTDDNLVWNLMQQTTPLQFITSASSPDGQYSVKYRNIYHAWYTRTSNIGNKGEPAPDSPTEYAVQLFEKGHPGAQVEVADRQEKPIASMFKPMATQTTKSLACSVKLRYTSNGTSMMAKVAFRYDGYDSGTAWGKSHGFSNGEWYLMDWSIVTGPESQFPKALRIGAVSLSSEHFDPAFFQQYMEVCAALTQQIAAEGAERLEIIRKSYHPINSFNKQKFDEQEAAKDRFTRAMCDYASDQQRFTDGKTQFIVPIGYKYAGVKDNGDVIVTDDPTYNKYKEWQEMNRVTLADN